MKRSLALGLCVSLLAMPVMASEKDTLKARQDRLSNELEQSKKAQAATDAELELTEAERDAVATALRGVNDRIDQLSEQIAVQQGEVDLARQEVAATHLSLTAQQDHLHAQQALLNERLRALQVSEDRSYLQVIFEARSFGDFVTRVMTAQAIAEQDQDLIHNFMNEVERLEALETTQRTQLAFVKQKERELIITKRQLDRAAAKKHELLSQLNEEVKSLELEQMTREEEQALLDEQQRAIEQQLAAIAEAERAAAEARAKREAEAKAKAEADRAEAERIERERQESEAARQDEVTVPDVTPPEADETEASTPVTTTGFVRPVSGYVSSPFGPRNNPLTGVPEIHRGIDLVNAQGTPIVAAAPGIVIKAGPATGYGNVVFVSHVLGGNVWTTVYAHLSQITVTQGQQVGSGQTLGTLGSTGWSTGPHLHFELHKGEWAPGQPNAIDPAPYIGY